MAQVDGLVPRLTLATKSWHLISPHHFVNELIPDVAKYPELVWVGLEAEVIRKDLKTVPSVSGSHPMHLLRQMETSLEGRVLPQEAFPCEFVGLAVRMYEEATADHFSTMIVLCIVPSIGHG